MKPLEDYLTDFSAYTAETLPGLVNGGPEVGVVDGKHYEMFVKTQVKNMLWYNAKAFTGTKPATWDDVLKVQPPSGAKLFCVGLESGADSGWPATDNIEGIIMRQSGDQTTTTGGPARPSGARPRSRKPLRRSGRWSPKPTSMADRMPS